MVWLVSFAAIFVYCKQLFLLHLLGSILKILNFQPEVSPMLSGKLPYCGMWEPFACLQPSFSFSCEMHAGGSSTCVLFPSLAKVDGIVSLCIPFSFFLVLLRVGNESQCQALPVPSEFLAAIAVSEAHPSCCG